MIEITLGSISNNDIEKYTNLVLDNLDMSNINVNNWLIIVTKTMEILDKVPDMTGKQKRDYCVEIVITIIEKQDIPDKDIIVNCLDGLPSIIDTIVMATKGNFDINKALPGIIGMIKNLIQCCVPKKTTT